MAQQNVVPSLFGITPELYQQNRMDELQARQALAARNAGTMLNPSLAPLYAQAAQRGQLEGEAIRAVGGLLGVEDPQLAKIRDVQQMKNQFDVSTPDGLRQFAQALSAKGYGDLALQAANEADKRTKLSSEAQMSEQKISQEKKLRDELNTLGENATDEDILRVVRKYGTPDQVMRAVQASLDKKNAATIKAASAVGKPLPASLQKDEGKDLEAYDSYASQKEALMPSIVNLTKDAEGKRKLELGPLKNATYAAQNLAGNSTPESRAFEALRSAVGTAVNLQVSAEKGVQTDKDVLRFADALIAAYGKNDTEATLEALQRYYDSINRAQSKAAGRIESRRKSQNVEPYFQGQPAATQPATATPAQPATKEISFDSLPKRKP